PSPDARLAASRPQVITPMSSNHPCTDKLLDIAGSLKQETEPRKKEGVWHKDSRFFEGSFEQGRNEKQQPRGGKKTQGVRRLLNRFDEQNRTGDPSQAQVFLAQVF